MGFLSHLLFVISVAMGSVAPLASSESGFCRADGSPDLQANLVVQVDGLVLVGEHELEHCLVRFQSFKSSAARCRSECIRCSLPASVSWVGNSDVADGKNPLLFFRKAFVVLASDDSSEGFLTDCDSVARLDDRVDGIPRLGRDSQETAARGRR